MKRTEISAKVISRLSCYRDALVQYDRKGVTTVFSEDLAAAIGNNSAQVRKDFSCTGICGKKKAGYHVRSLQAQIEKLLGTNEPHAAVLVGLGYLGRALVQEGLFEGKGFQVAACFGDEAPSVPNTRALYFQPLTELLDFVRDRAIKIGIIAGKAEGAQRALDVMAIAGVRGILNFTPARLKSPKVCIVNTVNLLHQLENLVFFAQPNDRKES